MVGAVVNGSRRPRDKSTATASRPPPPLHLGKVENCKVNHCKVNCKVHCKIYCKVFCKVCCRSTAMCAER